MSGSARIVRYRHENSPETRARCWSVDLDYWADKIRQREHSANIKAAPNTYEQSDPPKLVNILEFDCRGLEFTEFRSEVGNKTVPLRMTDELGG